MAVSTIPGYPRIGKHRELKRALEGYWSGKKSATELTAVADELRTEHRAVQRAAGLDLLPDASDRRAAPLSRKTAKAS